MAERPISTVINERQFSSADILQSLDVQHRNIVKANENLTLLQPHVDIGINVTGPIKLIPVGDTHLFSRYTNLDQVKKTLEMLEGDNSFGFITGDFIEGMNQGIPDHPGSVELDFGKQIVAASEILRPYFYAGKLLCAVDGYFGHEGWSRTRAGIGAVEMMARIMPKPDPKDPFNKDKWKYLPVIIQGGLLRLHLNNGKDPYVIKIMHDPMKGGSDTINRQGSLKREFLDEDDDMFLENGVHADMYIAGHLHHRTVVSKEVYFDRMSRKEKSVVFVQIGASKGTELNNLDPFGIANGKGAAFGPGPAIIIHRSRGAGNGDEGVTKEWVDYGYDKTNELYDVAKVLHQAEDRLNAVERQNLTSEIIGSIIDRNSRSLPVSEFNVRKSGRSPKEKPGRSPLFDDLSWTVSRTKDFPILVYLLQNARYGSASHDSPSSPYKNVFAEVLKEAAENPYKYVLVMRHFIDKGVARRIDRRSILERMANDLGVVSEQNRLLGIMLSSTLLDDGWTRDVVETKHHWDKVKRKQVADKIVDEGFRPGDMLYHKSAVSGVPLYVNESLLRMRVNQQDYSFFLLDKLGRSGSEFNMVQGLVQSRKKEHVTADITTGGHMPLAGFSVYPPRPRIYMAPGSFSNWDAGGKGNDKRVAAGGQAVILFSDKKFIIPTSNVSEAGDIFNALMMDKGLTDEEKRKLEKRSR